MDQASLPFPFEWVGVGIMNYREAPLTYASCQLDEIPPIPDHVLDGTYSWLRETPGFREEVRQTESSQEFDRPRVDTQSGEKFGFVAAEVVP